MAAAGTIMAAAFWVLFAAVLYTEHRGERRPPC